VSCTAQTYPQSRPGLLALRYRSNRCLSFIRERTLSCSHSRPQLRELSITLLQLAQLVLHRVARAFQQPASLLESIV